jgi:hypothetical protein
LVGGLLEELLRVVACGFGFGEGSGESVEGGVFDDLLHVIGHGPAYLADVSVHGLLGRPVLGEGGQGCGCGLFVGGLEVEQGLLGGADLLVVVAELVPSGGGDDDEDRGVEEHCQGGAVLGSGLAEHGAYGAPQCSGVMVFGPDAGAGGALERGRRLTELGAQVLGCEKGKGVECLAEDSEVGLAGFVVALVEVVGDALGGGGGLVPGVGPASARLVGGLRFDVPRRSWILGKDRSGASLEPEYQMGPPASPASATL